MIVDPWKQKRVGYISASRLDDLMSKGRKKDEAWGKSAISYLYQVEMERYLNVPPLERDAPALRFGREEEPYAVEWLRTNVNPDIRYYENDFDEKPFITVDWAKFGVTPDTDIVDENGKTIDIIEIKTTYSDGEIYKYFSPSRPYEKKRIDVLEEHRNQLAGQLLAFPDCKKIHLLKYNPQRDDTPWDTRSPLDPERGILFEFSREEFGSYLDVMKDRIIKADQYLNTGLELDLINEYYKYQGE